MTIWFQLGLAHFLQTFNFENLSITSKKDLQLPLAPRQFDFTANINAAKKKKKWKIPSPFSTLAARKYLKENTTYRLIIYERGNGDIL